MKNFIQVTTTTGVQTAINMDKVVKIEQSKYSDSPRMGDPMLIFYYENNAPTCIFGELYEVLPC